MARKRKPSSTDNVVDPVSVQPATAGKELPAVPVANRGQIVEAAMMPQAVLTELEHRQRNFWISCGEDHPRYAYFVLKCLGECDYSVDDYLNRTFMMSHLFIHSVELLAADQVEVVTLPRCVAINPEGETLKFVSVGAYDSFQTLVRLFGPQSWNPPLPIIIKKAQTRQGFSVVKLEIDSKFPLPKVVNWSKKLTNG